MTAVDGTDAARAAVPARGETDSRGGILNARAFRRSKLVYGTMAVAQGDTGGKRERWCPKGQPLLRPNQTSKESSHEKDRRTHC